MATPFLRVYEAFLARITADEWTLEEELAVVERDWQQLLEMAIFRFKYPRVSLNKIEFDPNPNDCIDKTFSCCFEGLFYVLPTTISPKRLDFSSKIWYNETCNKE